ncbi:hypothetical protein K7432_010990 [Basidiobolus ranarum]|uniref:Smr domain-containing protein n=1 Tax=Basidiobolus ranarum TaxID=34480 RepID=A0ABR2VV38_9FUNG
MMALALHVTACNHDVSLLDVDPQDISTTVTICHVPYIEHSTSSTFTFLKKLMGNLLSSQKLQGGSGDHCRQEADKYAQLRNECFTKSQALYKSGDKQGAKEESEKGKSYTRKMDAANKKAVELIFKEKNSSLPKNELDLHGLHVKEALAVVEERVNKCKRRKKIDHLTIIVGMGNHSADGVQRLKPAIESWLQQQNLTYSVDKPNRGCLFVELKGNTGSSCVIS